MSVTVSSLASHLVTEPWHTVGWHTVHTLAYGTYAGIQYIHWHTVHICWHTVHTLAYSTHAGSQYLRWHTVHTMAYST